MEKNNQNDSNETYREGIANNVPSSASSMAMPNPQEGANLDKKKEELLSMGKMGEDVSNYLNKISATTERPPEAKAILKQSIVRTLKTDTEEAIKLEQMSSVSMALAEQKRKERYPQPEPSADAPKSKKILTIIISLVLVFAGIAAFNFNYIKERVAISPEIMPEMPSLIISDHSTELKLSELEKNKMMVPLLKIISGNETGPNSIENIFITKNVAGSEKEKEMERQITSKEFLFLISSKTPDILMRSLTPEYMVGIHSLNGNHPFVILKTESYENAFAGMFVWEKTIARDLESLFSVNIGLNQNASNTAPTLAYNKSFEDILVKNKDARAIKDSSGHIVLIYSIPDKQTILITDNTETLAELFNRVIRSRTIR